MTQLRRGASPWAYLRPAALPAAALLAFCALVAAQWLGGIEGWASGAPASGDPHQTSLYLLLAGAYLGAFMLVLVLARTPERVRLVALTIIGSAFLQAMLAIVLFSAQASYRFLGYQVQHGHSTLGTFANRDHLAAYLYFGLSLAIGLLLGSIDEHAAKARRLRDHAVTAMKFVLSPRMLLRIMVVGMVVALVLTRSRMGNGAFFAALVVVGLTVAAVSPRLRKRALLLVLSFVLVDIVVIGQWVGLERVLERIDQTAVLRADQRAEETVEARTEPVRRTLPMIEERPLFGWGGGSYYTAFPPFKTPGMWVYWNFAHNDYAQIAAEVGLAGLALLLLVALATLWRAGQALRPGQSPLTRGIGYGALMAMLCIGLHSWVNFNLQIPANGLTFTAILALVWATPQRRLRGGGVDGNAAPD